MSHDAIRSVEAINRLDVLRRRAAKVEGLRDRLVAERAEKLASIDQLTNDIEKLLKVEELFRALMDQLVVKQVRALEAIVTDGLQTIFYDMDLYFESDIETKYNKVAIDFQIREGGIDDPLKVRGRPLDSFGGGTASVAALILRVLTVLKLKRLPFLILDEALLAVSDEYIAGTGKFLKALAETMNLHFLLITHKSAYCDHSDRAYQSHQELVAEQRTLRVKRVTAGDLRQLKARP
jgi:chromosome segregation ATPase